MRTTAILNLKGGVGKTCTCVNMAAIIAADYGKSVLVVDADSQANTTEFFGGVPEYAHTFADLLRDPETTQCWFPSASCGDICLLPADDSLMDLDLSSIESKKADVNCLREKLDDFARYAAEDPPVRFFDHVLIDCPPAFNAACAAALLAADDVIIPIKLDAFSLRGMANLTRQIQNMRRINSKLRLAGLLPTMVYRSDTILEAKAALEESKLFVFPPIRKTNKVDDMTFAQEPLIKSSPKSAACVDYRRFVKVYLEQEGGANNG